jgi:triacylglycerol lipase
VTETQAAPAIDVERRIEPQTVARLERLARWDTSSVETIRSSYLAVRPAPVPADPWVERTDAVIAGLDGRPDVAVRWYRPIAARAPLPCLVYLHGGAYIMGGLDENDDRLDRMALRLGCAVASVEWRLAPEHPYPEGLDDAETVWRRIAEKPAAFGVDGERLVLMGSSAGGGVAAALSLRLREVGARQPNLQVLIYPMLDDREVTPSIQALEGGPGHWGLWPIEAQRRSWEAYLGGLPSMEVPPTAAPARAEDVSGLAPAFIGVGDVDAYLDEDVRYAANLARCGVPTELHVYPGVIHGGFVARPDTPRTEQFLNDAYAAIAAGFAS